MYLYMDRRIQKRTYASSNRAMSKTIIEFVVLNYFYLQNYIFLIH